MELKITVQNTIAKTHSLIPGNLTNLKTRSIVPVDLNAMMCGNAQLMAEFHTKLDNRAKADYYRMIHARYMEAIEKVSLLGFVRVGA